MSLRRTLARTWEENILFSVLVELTYRCNLDCFFCYNDLGKSGKPLAKEQYFELFEGLRDLQVLNLALSGGEPLAHPDFLDLGRKARELGFMLRVKSNGHALRGRLAEILRHEIDPYVVEVSLHGATPATHDRQTRVEGSLERLVANVAEMLELGLRVRLKATLTRWNEDEIEPMYELADRLGVTLQFDATVTPRDDLDMTPLSIAPSEEGKRRMNRIGNARVAARIGRAAEVATDVSTGETPGQCAPKGGQSKNCGAGANSLTIDPYGDVFPCVQWRRSLGNLHSASIREIWEGSSELAEVRSINERAGEKARREGLSGFCMGLATEYTGDPLGDYADTQQEAQRQTRTGLPIVG